MRPAGAGAVTDGVGVALCWRSDRRRLAGVEGRPGGRRGPQVHVRELPVQAVASWMDLERVVVGGRLGGLKTQGGDGGRTAAFGRRKRGNFCDGGDGNQSDRVVVGGCDRGGARSRLGGL